MEKFPHFFGCRHFVKVFAPLDIHNFFIDSVEIRLIEHLSFWCSSTQDCIRLINKADYTMITFTKWAFITDVGDHVFFVCYDQVQCMWCVVPSESCGLVYLLIQVVVLQTFYEFMFIGICALSV